MKELIDDKEVEWLVLRAFKSLYDKAIDNDEFHLRHTETSITIHTGDKTIGRMVYFNDVKKIPKSYLFGFPIKYRKLKAKSIFIRVKNLSKNKTFTAELTEKLDVKIHRKFIKNAYHNSVDFTNAIKEEEIRKELHILKELIDDEQ